MKYSPLMMRWQRTTRSSTASAKVWAALTTSRRTRVPGRYSSATKRPAPLHDRLCSQADCGFSSPTRCTSQGVMAPGNRRLAMRRSARLRRPTNAVSLSRIGGNMNRSCGSGRKGRRSILGRERRRVKTSNLKSETRNPKSNAFADYLSRISDFGFLLFGFFRRPARPHGFDGLADILGNLLRTGDELDTFDQPACELDLAQVVVDVAAFA